MRQALIFEGDVANFNALVIDNSRKGPVMVNFWAGYAGPCLRLYPILERVVTEYAGRVLLVNVDIQKAAALAADHAVASLPHVKIFRDGKAVESIRHFEREPEIRAAVDRHLARASDQALLSAVNAYQAGKPQQALQTLAELAMQDPDNLRIPATLAKLLVNAGRRQQAFDLLDALPAEAKRVDAVGLLHAHLAFIQTANAVADAADAIPPAADVDAEDDPEAHFRQAACALIANDPDTALHHLLTLLRRHPAYRDEIARRGILAVLDMLDPQSALAVNTRRALAAALN